MFVALLVSMCSDPIPDMLVRGVALGPTELDCMPAFDLHCFIKVLPEVAIRDEQPQIMARLAKPDVIDDGTSTINEQSAIATNVDRSIGKHS